MLESQTAREAGPLIKITPIQFQLFSGMKWSLMHISLRFLSTQQSCECSNQNVAFQGFIQEFKLGPEGGGGLGESSDPCLFGA